MPGCRSQCQAIHKSSGTAGEKPTQRRIGSLRSPAHTKVLSRAPRRGSANQYRPYVFFNNILCVGIGRQGVVRLLFQILRFLLDLRRK